MTTRTAAKPAIPATGASTQVAGAARDASQQFGGFAADTQRTMSEQFEKVSKGIEGLSTFGQENVEAAVKSSERAAKAFEGIGSELSAFSRKAFEDGVAAAQDLASARTMSELLEKQTAYVQTSFEGWLHQTTKMNEILAAAAKDIAAPLGQRVTAATTAMKGFAL